MTLYKQYILFSYLTIGINILTGFMLFPLIINNLGLEALGVFGIFFSLKSILDIGMSASTSGVTKNLIKYRYIKNDIFTFSLFLNTAYGLVGLIIFSFYGYLFSSEYLSISLYFGLFILFNFSINTFYEVLISRNKQHIVALFRLILQLLFLLFSVPTFILLDNKSLDIIFVALLIASILQFLVVYAYYSYNFSIRLSTRCINKKLIYKILFIDGKFFLFNALSIILMLQIDVLLISFLYGSESAGIYLILFKIPNTLIMLGWRLSEPFRLTVIQRLKQKEYLEIMHDFLTKEKRILIISILLGMSYAILGKYILDIWIGKENSPSIMFMYIIPAFVVSLSTMQELYVSVNYYTSGINTVSILNMFQVFIKIIFIVLFFDFFAELAPIVGWMFSLMLTIYFYRKNSLKTLRRDNFYVK